MHCACGGEVYSIASYDDSTDATGVAAERLEPFLRGGNSCPNTSKLNDELYWWIERERQNSSERAQNLYTDNLSREHPHNAKASNDKESSLSTVEFRN